MALPSPDNYADWREYAKALLTVLNASGVGIGNPSANQVQASPVTAPSVDVPYTPDGYSPVWLSADDAALYLGNNNSDPPAAPDLFQIDTTNIANAAIKAPLIADASIGTAAIQDAAIVTALIGDEQVVNSKIANLAVDNAKIADLAVDSGKIANLAVATAHIQDLAVDTLKIAGNAVTQTTAAVSSTIQFVPYAVSESVPADGISVTLSGLSGGPVRVDYFVQSRTLVYSGPGVPPAIFFRVVRIQGAVTTEMVSWRNLADIYYDPTIFLDVPAAGSATYKIQFAADQPNSANGTDHFNVELQQLFALEVKR